MSSGPHYPAGNMAKSKGLLVPVMLQQIWGHINKHHGGTDVGLEFALVCDERAWFCVVCDEAEGY